MLKERFVCKGVTVSTGAAVGVLVFNIQEALVCSAAHQPCILVCKDMHTDEQGDGLAVRVAPCHLFNFLYYLIIYIYIF